jgi:hypothetical protein
MTRTLCLVAALSMLTLSGCRSTPATVPMMDDSMFYQPGEVNPDLSVVVQVVKPADAVSLTVRLTVQNTVYTRTFDNLPDGTFFIAERATTFFNAPDLLLLTGQRYPVEATFRKANGDTITPVLRFDGSVTLNKMPGALLVVVKNYQQ